MPHLSPAFSTGCTDAQEVGMLFGEDSKAEIASLLRDIRNELQQQTNIHTANLEALQSFLKNSVIRTHELLVDAKSDQHPACSDGSPITEPCVTDKTPGTVEERNDTFGTHCDTEGGARKSTSNDSQGVSENASFRPRTTISRHLSFILADNRSSPKKRFIGSQIDGFGSTGIEFPVRTPPSVGRLLWMITATSLDGISIGRRCVYRMYRMLVFLCALMSCCYYLLNLYINLTIFPEPVSLDVALLLSSLLTLRNLRVWRRHMSSGGATISMMQWASAHGFKWESVTKHVHITVGLILIVNFTHIVVVIAYWCLGTSTPQRLIVEAPDKRYVATLLTYCEFISLPARLLWHAVMLGYIWIIHFTARFHRYDLLCYAKIMTGVLEISNPDFDVVANLLDLETVVAARLRHASATWVRTAVHCIIGDLVALVLLSATLVLSRDVTLAYIGVTVFVMAILFGLLICMVWPLAHVAETFEYDVLRTLNNPVVLSRARKYVGDQMLPHLQTLDWGFRFSGAVITPRVVVTVLFAMVAALVGSVCQALFDIMDKGNLE